MMKFFLLCIFTGRVLICWEGTDALLISLLTIPHALNNMLFFSTGKFWIQRGEVKWGVGLAAYGKIFQAVGHNTLGGFE